MTKTFVLAAVLAATLSGSAFAQSYDQDYGTGNVNPRSQVTDQGMEARAQVIDSKHQALKSTFTKQERALFNRIPLED